jgi:DHA1 family multidrug resistance protein-like MFS transporter
VRPPLSATRLPREIWVLVGAGFIIAVGYGIIAPVLPRFAQSFDVGATAAAAVVSAFALARLVFAPAGGFLTTRLGERRVYVAGVFIVALSTGAVAFASSYPQLLVFRGLGGIGSVMFTVASATLVIRIAPPLARGKATAMMGSAMLFGGIAGPVVGTALSGLGMRAPFAIYMVALLIAASLVMVLLPEVPKPDGTRQVQAAPMAFGEAAQDNAFRASLVTGFVSGWANLGIRMAIVPLLAVTLAGAGDWSAGAALTAFAVGNAAALVFAGSLSDRIGRKPPIVFGLTITGLATAVAGFVGGVWLFIGLCAIAGAGAGVFGPAQQAVVADVVGNERSGGKVTAGFQMAADLGSILGPLAAGAMVDHGGYEVAFGLAGLLCLLSAAQWLPARESNPGVLGLISDK